VALMTDAAISGVDRACSGGECEKAVDLLEQAIRRTPNRSRLYYRLGVCYGGGCRRHSLTHPEMAAAYLRQALRLQGANATYGRAAILDQLGTTLIHCRSTPRLPALRESIECQKEAAQIYDSLGKSDDWARVQYNLGNSCCDLAESSGEDRWSDAVLHYEQALRIRTRDKDPERYAALLENLGTAYRRLNVRKSIQCYRHALWVYGLAAYPEKHAAVQNNLGNAFLSLPDSRNQAVARNATRALHHFERALRVHSRDKHSRAYGITQYNRAQALFRLAAAAPGERLACAVECLEEAFRAFAACGEERYNELIRSQLERICLT
jgi:tetratricopeptide (TPR) repeat protein